MQPTVGNQSHTHWLTGTVHEIKLNDYSYKYCVLCIKYSTGKSSAWIQSLKEGKKKAIVNLKKIKKYSSRYKRVLKSVVPVPRWEQLKFF